MTIFWWLLDIMILVSIAVSVYWQSQITIHARYNYWSFGYGLIFFILLIGGQPMIGPLSFLLLLLF